MKMHQLIKKKNFFYVYYKMVVITVQSGGWGWGWGWGGRRVHKSIGL